MFDTVGSGALGPKFSLLVLQEMAAAQRGWFMPASAAFAPLAARSGYRATELFEVGSDSD